MYGEGLAVAGAAGAAQRESAGIVAPLWRPTRGPSLWSASSQWVFVGSLQRLQGPRRSALASATNAAVETETAAALQRRRRLAACEPTVDERLRSAESRWAQEEALFRRQGAAIRGQRMQIENEREALAAQAQGLRRTILKVQDALCAHLVTISISKCPAYPR
eukprot:SM000031S11560  [mRNA]  locus=s31:347674:348691:- [translate_table: standard]